MGGNPVMRLKSWLKKSDGNASQLDHKLEEMYKIVVHGVWLGTDEEDDSGLDSREQHQLMDMLRSIVLLATPLPASLHYLLGVSPDDINLLKNLRAVFDIPSDDNDPVEMLHKSFSDFLLGTDTDSFRVDATETHAMLASKCIDRIKRKDGGLRKDMCNLQDYGKLRDDIGETIIREVIPRDLEYACLNWVNHLQQCGQDITNEDKIRHHITDEDIYDFLREHFLHWLEALSPIGAMSESDALVGALPSLIAPDGNTDLSDFLDDAKRFVLRNRGIVDTTPLQLYSSAIIFAPETSITRDIFKDQIPERICRVPKMPPTWRPELQKLGRPRRVGLGSDILAEWSV